MKTTTLGIVAGAAMTVMLGSLSAHAAITAPAATGTGVGQVTATAAKDTATFKVQKGINYAVAEYQFTTPPPPVPVPAALPLLASALVGLGVVRRRAKKQA
ncbi:MAG: VPLPA-CTERM sorting domain-containing protein [Geminicoccaceae bacterium]